MSWTETDIQEVLSRLLNAIDEDDKITEEQMQEWHERDIEDGWY